MSLLVTRHELRELLERWQKQHIGAAEVLAWVRQRWPWPGLALDDQADELSVAGEVLAVLDLLMVHLLTPEDVPALLALLDAPSGAEQAAIDGLRRHCASIDRRARSRVLRRDPLYRPFCV